MWISEELYDSPVLSALSSSAPNVHYLQNTHPHTLSVGLLLSEHTNTDLSSYVCSVATEFLTLVQLPSSNL
jgi:hypothetical protein